MSAQFPPMTTPVFLNHCQACHDSVPVGPVQPQCGPSSQLTDTVTQHPRHQTPRERIPSHPMKCARSRTASHWQTWPQPTTEITRSTELTALEMTPKPQSSNGMASVPQQKDLTLLVSHWFTNWGLLLEIPSESTQPHVREVSQKRVQMRSTFGQRVFL